MVKNNTLALFDFDGTITRKDTFIELIKFTHGPFRFWFSMWLLSPILFLYICKLIRNDKAKMILFRFFYGGWKYERFSKSGEDFCENKLPGLLRASALEKLSYHQKNGDRIIVVTASGKEWVEPWCKKMGIEILSTEPEVIDHIITGKFATPNCYGPEKVRRIQSLLSLPAYDTIYAYGDSGGDKEMLSIAQNSHYKSFSD
jgi:HAD superfamily hydrolase (TIGR01490 family)